MTELQLVRPAYGYIVHWKEPGKYAALCGREPASRARAGWYLCDPSAPAPHRRICPECAQRKER